MNAYKNYSTNRYNNINRTVYNNQKSSTQQDCACAMNNMPQNVIKPDFNNNNNSYSMQNKQQATNNNRYSPNDGYNTNNKQAPTSKNRNSESIEYMQKMNIVDYYTKNSFISASRRSFNIDKLILTFGQFDSNSGKRSRKVDIYINFKDFYRIFEGIVGSKQYYAKEAYNNFKNKGNSKYAKDVILITGGTSSQKLKIQNKSRQDGKSEYRALSLTYMLNTKNEPCLYLKAINGPGKVNPTTKGIVSDGSPDFFIGVVFTFPEIVGFFNMCKSYIDAYISSKVQEDVIKDILAEELDKQKKELQDMFISELSRLANMLRR